MTPLTTILEFRIVLDPTTAARISLQPLLESNGGVYAYDTTTRPPRAIKVQGNGDLVVIQRVVRDDRHHEIIAQYHGAIGDLGSAHFALGNVFLDLVDVGLFPRPETEEFTSPTQE